MDKKKINVLKNIGIMFGILALASVLCFLLTGVASTDTHVPLIFVVAVMYIAWLTKGYVYGVVASVLAVIGVNYAFTYPHFAFNFTITGYPVTFLAMLAVSLLVSTMMIKIHRQEEIRLESEKEKMRGNLLRAVSHDIRTPLTSIMGAASAILDNYEALSVEKRKELVLDIKEEAQWLIRIVENLLSITRISGDGAQLNKTEEVVEEIISSAILKFKKQYPSMPVRVDMPEEVMLVPMDGILIEQVLVNLMENAVRHGKTTSQIRIQVSQTTDKAIFAVEDNGQGIKKSLLPVIFDGAYQEDEETADAKRNMGIGLSVCKSIIKAHRGNMKADNLTEGGARIQFWIPKEEKE